ncbi:MAG: hypothetical protein CSA70_08035 [Rhodobacterales bacterium]|nr:MAG: hypothetical protein CSA70_08035 [Rhodobacterales bacterium]
MGKAHARRGARVRVTDVDETAIAGLPSGWRGTVCDASDEGAMKALFDALGPFGIRVNAICPGAVDGHTENPDPKF